jgi:hypothetical protein
MILFFCAVAALGLLMAAPTPTARVEPTGAKLKEGHATKITLAIDTNIEFWEKEVTPPGIEGGEPVMQGDMFSLVWETRVPQALKDMTEVAVTANYDPAVMASAVAAINVPTTITITWPPGGTLAFYGFMRSFKPNPLKKGEQPNAAVVIVPTNWDHINGVEAGPVYTAPP